MRAPAQEPQAAGPVELPRERREGTRLRRRIEIHEQPALSVARQPMLFGRSVDQDPVRGIALGPGGQELEFADHFETRTPFPPPAQERPQRLGLAGKPVTNRQMPERRVQLRQRLLQGHD